MHPCSRTCRSETRREGTHAARPPTAFGTANIALSLHLPIFIRQEPKQSQCDKCTHSMLDSGFDLPLCPPDRAVEGSKGLREAPLVPDDVSLCSCMLLDPEAVPQNDSGGSSNGWRINFLDCIGICSHGMRKLSTRTAQGRRKGRLRRLEVEMSSRKYGNSEQPVDVCLGGSFWNSIDSRGL